jgi:hypothetical protein
MGGTMRKIGRNGKMGLDMYLTGDKFKRTEFVKDSNGEILRDEDGYALEVNQVLVDEYKCSSQRLEVGYWRKHAPLHNFIVNAFADGEDNCRPIDLSAENLRWIAKVLRGENEHYALPDNDNCHGFSLVTMNGGTNCVRTPTRMRRLLTKPQIGWTRISKTISIGIQSNIRRVGNERFIFV